MSFIHLFVRSSFMFDSDHKILRHQTAIIFSFIYLL